jgi:uncharacterized protein YkwD
MRHPKLSFLFIKGEGMKKSLALFFVLLTSVAGCGKSNSSGTSEGRVDPIFTDPARSNEGALSDLLWLLNDHRRRLGLTPLRSFQVMNNEAEAHAQNMSDLRSPLGHAGLANRCLRARQALGGGNACGEIVAAGQSNSEAALRSWLNSWGHRRQIEDPRYTLVGLGVAISRTGRPYWSVMFLQY